MKILVAEDDETCMLILVLMLKKLGHTVVEAVNGLELYEKFRKSSNEYDIIITDIMMPYMNGLEAIREIKKIRDIKTIAITALSDDTLIKDNKGEYLSWSISNYYIRKPISLSLLTSILSNIQHQTIPKTNNT